MFMPPIQMSSFVEMLTCSDEVQPSVTSFIASQQLQTEANIYPTEMSLHSTLVFQQNTGIMAVDQFHFLLVQDAEISEINKLTVKTAASKNIARATKTWMAAWAEWCKARNINLLKTVSEKRKLFHIASGYVPA